MSFETAGHSAVPPKFIAPAAKTLAPRGSRVVRHFGRLTWAEGVRYPREDARALRRAPRLRVDLDAVLAEAGTVPEPGTAEEPRCPLGADDDVGLVRVTVVVPADVLGPGERALLPTDVTPAAGSVDRVAVALDAVEEAVGREEREVAAQVAVALDQVVGMRRHVLLVPGEDDQVVQPSRADPPLPIRSRSESEKKSASLPVCANQRRNPRS